MSAATESGASVEKLEISEQQAPAAAAAAEVPHPSGLSLEERFQLCRSVAEECINDDELRKLLQNKPSITAYDGFEVGLQCRALYVQPGTQPQHSPA
jgi:tyrosyl-tRNA synthetase